MTRKKLSLVLLAVLWLVLAALLHVRAEEWLAESSAREDARLTSYFEDTRPRDPLHAAEQARAAALDGDFTSANRLVLSAISPNNALRYLYEDLPSAFEADTRYCPNAGSAFIRDLAQGRKVSCSRVAYRASEHQSFSILVQGTPRGKRRLLIYNHGHDGLPRPTEQFAREFLSTALEGGFDVLLVSMPFTGVDRIHHPFRIRTWDGTALVPNTVLHDDQKHGILELVDTGSSHYIRFFIDSAVESAVHLRSRYDSMDFVGLSGGANTGLYACAVMANLLDNCILVSGVMPMNLRAERKNFGDPEQWDAGLQRRHNVFDVIADLRASRTRLHMFYSNRDSCCFADPAATSFRAQLRDRGLGSVPFHIRDSDEHGFDPAALLKILRHGS